jgi:hypothetical protein
LPYVPVAAVAFALRLTAVLIGAGFASSGRYDDSVYYAAADALTFGRLPYRDYVMLHPPGIALMLSPFALFGRLTTDRAGMIAAQIFFMLVGAANAVLVAMIARRWGRLTSLAAGLLYACWQPAIYSEQTTLLEPLGTTALLVALLLLFHNRTSGWRMVTAGAVLGAAATLKIWYVAPFIVLVGWSAIARGVKQGVLVLAAGAGVIAVVLTPFFAFAPQRMYDMVIRDQFARSAGAASRTARLPSILTGNTFVRGYSPAAHPIALVVGLLLMVAVARCLTLGREAVALVLMLATSIAVLLAGPTYFYHYAELAAAPIVLVLVVGWSRLLSGSFVASYPRWATTAAMLMFGGYLAVHVGSIAEGHYVDWTRLGAAAPAGCVASDSPEALIGMDRLSSDLRAGCTEPVDVGGLGYDLLQRRGGRLVYVSRAHNVRWQQFLYRYLTNAQAFVLLRGRGEIMPNFYRALTSHRPIASYGSVVLRAGAPSRQ